MPAWRPGCDCQTASSLLWAPVVEPLRVSFKTLHFLCCGSQQHHKNYLILLHFTAVKCMLLTVSPGCGSCLRLGERIADLEERVSTLHQFNVDGRFIDSVITVGRVGIATTGGELDSTVPCHAPSLLLLLLLPEMEKVPSSYPAQCFHQHSQTHGHDWG